MAAKSKEKPKVHEITLGLVISWIFGLIFIVFGLGVVVQGSYFAGTLMILFSVMIIPYFNTLTAKKFNFEISGGLKAGLAIVIIILWFYAVSQYSPNVSQSSTNSTEQIKQSIVYIKHDVTGVNQYGKQSSLLGGSGSGVIIYKEGSVYYVITSRHVVDCIFAGQCIYPTNEKITIRTRDGIFYNPTGVLFAPKNLDLAILKFQSNSQLSPVIINSNYAPNDYVTAIGYPSFSASSAEPILEFSVTQGRITNVRELLTYQGLSFTGIDSNALTGPGASGGGLFNRNGELIGIITWGSRVQPSTLIAIDIKAIANIAEAQKNFFTCPSNAYPTLWENCCYYGEIAGNDEKCHLSCGLANYCESGSQCCNGQCYYACPLGYVFDTSYCRCRSV